MRFEDLDEVNNEVNRLPYVSDAQRYFTLDFWNEIDANGGDCEDYAIGKLNRLVDRRWPIAQLRLACCYVEGAYHAVLLVETDRGAYMLDNRQPRPVPLGDVESILGYKPDCVQGVGGSRQWVTWTGAITQRKT